MLELVQGGSNFPGSKCHLKGGVGKGLIYTFILQILLALVLPFCSSVLPFLNHTLVISYFLGNFKSSHTTAASNILF